MTDSELISQLHDNLVSGILPYWIGRMSDGKGGIFGHRDGYDTLYPEAPRGAILNARVLWTFSAAFRCIGNPEYRKIADDSFKYISLHFIDKEYGGVYWSLDHSGFPLDTKKQFYAIAFTIYGLAEYFRATGTTEALVLAQSLFEDIERHSYDKINKGYIEASTREWQPIADMRLSDKDENASKTMNTHLHILEAYTALLRVWDNDRLRETHRQLVNLFFDRIEDSTTHHLGLFFNDRWQRLDKDISYGHDIEASWLLLEAAEVNGNQELREKALQHCRRIAIASLKGRLQDGSMIYERHADDNIDYERHWWVQAECVVGMLYLWKYHGMEEMKTEATRTWEYIRDHLIDQENGEWFWSISPDGSINRKDDKAGFWKCPYHNSRMHLEALSILGYLPTEQTEEFTDPEDKRG